MDKPHVLIVDDEENIRLTLSQALGTLPAEIDTAANGQEALDKLEQRTFAVILLDLRMPGMNGMQVLERLRESRPEIPVIIITAHGTIESAVDAMQLGAIEFLQKPFVPDDVRRLVSRVLQRGKLRESEAADYATHFNLAKRCLSERHGDAAIEHLRKAISISPERPEAYNLLGAVHEIRGEIHEALNNYRAAWSYDASYEPSQLNIERATSAHPRSRPILLGELRDDLGDRG
jgi:DNA-binding response OmpR family regulator